MINILSIKNFKALKNIDLDIYPLNILSGINGVGKSSLIQVLLLLKQTIEAGKVDEGLLLKGKYIDIGRAKDVFSDGANIEEGISIYLEIGEDYTDLNYKYSKELESEFILPLKTKDISDSFIKSDIFQKRCSYLKSYRISPEIKYSLTSDNNENDIGISGEFTTQFLAPEPDDNPTHTEKKVKLKELIKASNDDLTTNVSKWLTILSENIQVQPSINKDYEFSSIKYRFQTANEYTNWYSSLNVGYGFTSVLPIVVKVLSAKKGDIIIIENPEDQLHPKAQSKLGYMFAIAANAGVQLFVETHSDHIINGIRVAVKNKNIKPDEVGILFFERKKESEYHESKIIRLNIDESGSIEEYPKDFLDEWDKQLDELLKG